MVSTFALNSIYLMTSKTEHFVYCTFNFPFFFLLKTVCSDSMSETESIQDEPETSHHTIKQGSSEITRDTSEGLRGQPK